MHYNQKVEMLKQVQHDNKHRGFTLLESIGQVKPDASHKQTWKLSGSRLTYPCYHGFTPCRHPEPALLPLRAALKGCYSGSNKTVSGSSRFINGFTLIELLVVVLIIGILAAVALPQYQKAVMKARLAEYKVVLKTLYEAKHVCELQKGAVCGNSDLSNMDIELPSCNPLPGWEGCSYGFMDLWSPDVLFPTVYPHNEPAYYDGFLYLADIIHEYHEETHENVLLPSPLQLRCSGGNLVDCTKIEPLINQ